MTADRTFTIYLLHFGETVGRSRHYLGICKSDRWIARMREHAAGRGASLTARAAAANVSMWVVRRWPSQSFDRERSMKAAGHLSRHCPVCQLKLDDTAADVQFYRLPPPPLASKWFAAEWK